MKFCDKLAKQRKNNNLSQEQLAEKLNVSRQAVSKWESGSSYPDMEKIIQICGILNCLDNSIDASIQFLLIGPLQSIVALEFKIKSFIILSIHHLI